MSHGYQRTKSCTLSTTRNSTNARLKDQFERPNHALSPCAIPFAFLARCSTVESDLLPAVCHRSVVGGPKLANNL